MNGSSSRTFTTAFVFLAHSPTPASVDGAAIVPSDEQLEPIFAGEGMQRPLPPGGAVAVVRRDLRTAAPEPHMVRRRRCVFWDGADFASWENCTQLRETRRASVGGGSGKAARNRRDMGGPACKPQEANAWDQHRLRLEVVRQPPDEVQSRAVSGVGLGVFGVFRRDSWCVFWGGGGVLRVF